MWLVLFGASLYEVNLPAVNSPEGACWLLDATQRRFQEGTFPDLDRFLSLPVGEEQPQLFAT